MNLSNREKALQFIFSLSAAAFCLATAFNTVDAQLIGHYPLDSVSSGTTPDTTSINGAGTLNGSVTLSAGAGKIGGAFDFAAGVGNFVGINDAGFGQNAFTTSVWFRPDGSLDNGDPVANWTNAGPSPRTFLIRTSGGNLQTFVRDSGPTQIGGSAAFPTETLSTTDFNHAVITYDGQTLRTYLNGELSTSMPAFATPRAIGQGVQGTAAIGGRGSSEQNMDGLVDDLAFWSETLTDGKVAALFNLADAAALNYDASQADQLFQVFDGDLTQVEIGNLTWLPDSGLGGTAGDVVDLGGGNFFLNLDGVSGVSTLPVPEPASVAIWSLIGLGLAGFGYTRIRRKK